MFSNFKFQIRDAYVGKIQAFAFPDYEMGNIGGSGFESLSLNQIPEHNHSVMVQNSYDQMTAEDNYLGNPAFPTSESQSGINQSGALYYTEVLTSNETTLDSKSISSVGNNSGDNKHENRMPFLVRAYCIATESC